MKKFREKKLTLIILIVVALVITAFSNISVVQNKLAEGASWDEIKYGSEYRLTEISADILIVEVGNDVRNKQYDINPVPAFEKALMDISNDYHIKSITPLTAAKQIDVGGGSFTNGLIIFVEKK